MTFVLATNNPGKAREFEKLAEGRHEILSLAAFSLALSPAETGSTFEENALIKARETADYLVANGHTGYAVIADDSGLEVDALNGAPGVDSAVFLGEDATYPQRHAAILDALDKAPAAPRTARFVCCIACVLPGSETLTARGTLEGEIAAEPAGEGGFGYDPIFYVPQFNCTTAQLTSEQKNAVSHRGSAFRELLRMVDL